MLAVKPMCLERGAYMPKTKTQSHGLFVRIGHNLPHYGISSHPNGCILIYRLQCGNIPPLGCFELSTAASRLVGEYGHLGGPVPPHGQTNSNCAEIPGIRLFPTIHRACRKRLQAAAITFARSQRIRRRRVRCAVWMPHVEWDSTAQLKYSKCIRTHRGGFL